MSVIDAVMLGAPVAVAILLVVAPRLGRRVGMVAVSVLIPGHALLWLFEPYRQWWPLYLLLVAMLVVVATTGRELLGRIGIGVLAAISAAVWLVPPVPELPEPTGHYAVGSEIFRWVDPARPEPRTEADDRRNVVVQAWYPTESAAGRRWVYLDGQDALPSQVAGVPSLIMGAYSHIDTHAFAQGPVSRARQRWPVVLFSPGYGAPRAYYSGLVADLASRGFVVLAVDHPYESAVTELADGTIAHTVETLPVDDPRFMVERQEIRTADLRFVLDRIGAGTDLGPLTDRLDPTHISAVGHSFGGAAALSALSEDRRLTAAANLDGTLYSDLPQRTIDRPVLILESDRDITGHSARYLDGNADLLRRLRAPSFRYEIDEADHFGFTDASHFVSAPVRFVATLFVGGSRGPTDTQWLTNDILTPFLLGDHPGIATAAARHPGVSAR
ncbi:alpha/beta hydrolase family protein [Nocardia caishijiensis]|uniref:alpha/beta hydrolase family protein n=1 Tax=Nocardia caishijiensis TaxID=184756 RepID=UPI0008296FD1|nr:hypothetical protein [Nocardia caishijiensis]